MNQKILGSAIASLRKGNKMTQANLANALNVSNKAVSRWENGLGYPEITLLPRIAAIFGVTVDYLLTGECSGITIAGTIHVDILKQISDYSADNSVSLISSISKSIGGRVPITAVNLAKIDPSVPIGVIGCVGDDDAGRYVVSEMQRSNIDTKHIRIVPNTLTGTTDIMHLTSENNAVFHASGADKLFSASDIDIQSLTCRLFHIGDALSLEHFHAPDPHYRTVMARTLHDLQEAGIRTSIDAIGRSHQSICQRVVLPALSHCDYVILRDIICCKLWGLKPRRPDGSADIPAIRQAMERTLSCGVGEKVIVRSDDAGFCLSKNGDFTIVPQLDIPPEEMKGTPSIGDAFCAGCLYSIYHYFSDTAMLEFAFAAVASHHLEDTIYGMRSREDLLQVSRKYSPVILPEE